LGVLRIASVEDQLSVAVLVNKTGDWASNLRIIDARAKLAK